MDEQVTSGNKVAESGQRRVPRWAAVAPLLPGLVLAVGLLLTWQAAEEVQRQQRAEVATAFHFRVEQIHSRILTSLRGHEQMLRGVAGLFTASAEVSASEFRRYIAALNVQRNYPGIQGVGFAKRLRAEGEQGDPLPLRPDEVWPASTDADIRTGILYLEPRDWRNQRAMGFDMYSDPVRREAMRRAMERGTTALSDQVFLVQEADLNVQPGFLIYLPIYRSGPVNTPEQRRQQLLGWAYAPYRSVRLMRSLLGPHFLAAPTPVDIAVYDGAEVLPQRLLYDSRQLRSADDRFVSSLESLRHVRFGGHTWTVVVHGTPMLETHIDNESSLPVLLSGSGITVLLVAVLWLMAHGRARAYALAQQMTHELAESESRFRNMANAAPVMIWMLGTDQRVVWVNKGWVDFTGRDPATETVDSWYADMHPDEREAVFAQYREAYAQRMPYDVEFRVRDRNGHYRWLFGRAIPRFNQMGGFEGFIGSCVDITERREAEQRVTEANQLLNSVLAAATEVGIIATDLEGTIRLFNRGAEKMLGYAADEVVGNHTPALFHLSEEVERYAAWLSEQEGVELRGAEVFAWEVARTGEAVREWTLERRDGQRLRVSLAVTALRDASGNTTGWLGIARDITAQYEAERQLVESERRLRAIFDSSWHFVALMAADGRLLEVNEPSLRAVRASRDDVLGQPFWLSPWWGSRSQVREALRNAIGEAAASGSTAHYEVALELDGDRAVELDASIRPVLDEHGNVVLLVFEGLDVTERRYAERQLAQQRQFLDKLMSEIPEMVSYWDADRRCRFANAAWLRRFGQDGRPVIGKTIEQILGELYRDMSADVEAVFGGASQMIERTLSQGDSLSYLLAHYVPDVDEDGARWLILVLTDITALKEIERSLQQQVLRAENATRAKGDFLANMSHEIRTPMNAVLGLSRLLGDTRLDAEQQDYIDKIHSSSRALLQILNDILDYSKVEAGRLELEQADFDLDVVLEGVADLFAVMAEEKRLDLVFEVEADVPMILRGDALRLGQVLNNLVGNAVKFTPTGMIQVTVKCLRRDVDGPLLQLSIADTGIGMSPEQIGSLFQPFHQGDTSTTRRFGGTGLGLAISRRLVHLMGGEIGVESTAGEGTTFCFSVRFGAPLQPRPSTDVALEPMRVMVVNDRMAPAQAMCRTLATRDFDVEIAHPEQASERARAALTTGRGYEMLILECAASGEIQQAAARLHRLQAELGTRKAGGPAILIVISGHARDRLLAAAGAMPPDGLVIKPVTPSRLFHALANVQRGDGLAASATGETMRRWHHRAQPIAGARILLAEDNPINQQVAVAILTRMGLKVDVASTGREAVARASSETYDAVLMDLQMPEMDGFEAASLIRARSDRVGLPIIAMTAAAMSEDRAATVAAGMNGHVAKPVNPEELLDELLRWVPPRRPPA